MKAEFVAKLQANLLAIAYGLRDKKSFRMNINNGDYQYHLILAKNYNFGWS